MTNKLCVSLPDETLACMDWLAVNHFGIPLGASVKRSQLIQWIVFDLCCEVVKEQNTVDVLDSLIETNPVAVSQIIACLNKKYNKTRLSSADFDMRE